MLGSISHSSLCLIHSFKIQPGSAGWSRTRPTHDWNQARLKKNKGRKNPIWPGGLTWQPGQKPDYNPLTFVFFLLKRYRFKFFLKKNWPDQNPEPEPLTRTATRPDLKIMILWTHVEVSNQIELKHGNIHNIIISQPFLSALM